MMEPSALLHGSPAGFAAGCRSKGGCRWHRSAVWLTCVEAAAARAGDAQVARIEDRARLPRDASKLPRIAREWRLTHGTINGYRRGCRDAELCPHAVQGLLTCSEARRDYLAAYVERRRSGQGAAVAHGTRRGYYAGCRRHDGCPARLDGPSCVEEFRRYGRDKQRMRRGGPSGMVDATDLVHALSRLVADGIPLQRIADRASVSRSTLSRQILLAAAGRERCEMVAEVEGRVRIAVEQHVSEQAARAVVIGAADGLVPGTFVGTISVNRR